jgi:hypothetical protein
VGQLGPTGVVELAVGLLDQRVHLRSAVAVAVDDAEARLVVLGVDEAVESADYVGRSPAGV